MIEPGNRVLHGFDRGNGGQRRPAQHDHVDSERSCRHDLAVGRIAAAVLGDDDIDLMFRHQFPVIGLREWSACREVGRIWHRQWRIDRINAADEIAVLRRLGECRDIPAAGSRTPTGPRPLGRGELLPGQILEQHRQRAIDDFGQVSTGDGVSEQVLGLA